MKNGALDQIRWEQIGFLGNPEYGVRFSDMDFVKFAEACGGAGYRIEDHDQVRTVLKGALSEKRPTIIEALVDANEPPYPAHTGKKYVENFAKALIKGQPGGERMALTMFREKIKEP